MTKRKVFNGSWNNLASEKGVERATEKITKAIADVNKDSQKVADAVKAGSEKIVDAVGKIKSTNNAEQTTAPILAVSTGLRSIAESANRISERIRNHPSGELGATIEAGTAIGRQFVDLLAAAKTFDEGNEKLRGTVESVTKGANWLVGEFCGRGNDANGTVGRLGDF